MTLNAIAKLCACTMAFAATMPLAAAVETVNGIEWNYTVSNGKAMLGGGSSLSRAVSTSTSGSITIPSTLGGCPVTSIGKYAFYDCRMLTSVMIPSSDEHRRLCVQRLQWNKECRCAAMCLYNAVIVRFPVGAHVYYECGYFW